MVLSISKSGAPAMGPWRHGVNRHGYEPRFVRASVRKLSHPVCQPLQIGARQGGYEQKSSEAAMDRRSGRSLEIIPTGAALGADIGGIDLAGEIDSVVFQDIYKAWNDHLVLRFRGQRLNDDALVAFSRRFGDLDKAPTPHPGRAHGIEPTRGRGYLQHRGGG